MNKVLSLFLLISLVNCEQFHIKVDNESEKRDQPTFPNIGYLGTGKLFILKFNLIRCLGYDLVSGNPHSNLYDPGFRQNVIDLSYSGKTTSDLRFQIPDGTQVKSLQTCSYDSKGSNSSNWKYFELDKLQLNLIVYYLLI